LNKSDKFLKNKKFLIGIKIAYLFNAKIFSKEFSSGS